MAQPTFKSAKSLTFLFNGNDMSGYFSSCEVNKKRHAEKTTTFAAGAGETYLGCLSDGTVSLDGFFVGGAAAVNGLFDALLTSPTNAVSLIAPFGTGTLGYSCYLLTDILPDWKPASSKVAGVVGTHAGFQADKGLDLGIILCANATITGTGTQASQDNGASTANGGVAQVHCTGATALTSASTEVDHSADNITFAALTTFSAITAAQTAQENVVAGGTTVNRYLQFKTSALTGTNFTATAAFARR